MKFIPNLLPNALVPEAMGKSSHENAPQESQSCASSHKQSDSDESTEEFEKSTAWIFQGYLFFCSDQWLTDETYEALYLPLGSGQRYQILSHVFAHCLSQKPTAMRE